MNEIKDKIGQLFSYPDTVDLAFILCKSNNLDIDDISELFLDNFKYKPAGCNLVFILGRTQLLIRSYNGKEDNERWCLEIHNYTYQWFENFSVTQGYIHLEKDRDIILTYIRYLIQQYYAEKEIN